MFFFYYNYFHTSAMFHFLAFFPFVHEYYEITGRTFILYLNIHFTKKYFCVMPFDDLGYGSPQLLLFCKLAFS